MARRLSVDGSADQRRSVAALWLGLLVGVTVAVLTTSLQTIPDGRFLLGVAGAVIVISAVATRPVTTDSRLTVATAITLARGAALAVLAGFLFVGAAPVTWLPAALFAIAAGLDAVDGVVARATDTVTDLGAQLDTEMDGLTVLLGSLLVVSKGLAPAVFLGVGLARYAFVAGIGLRQRRGLPVFELPPSQLRRLLGGFAMSAIWVALLPMVDTAVSRPLSLAVLVPFLANFVRDWLAVSGRR
ncbi:CDP-alcohol phosphatidyltransferase family protein [Halohasta salina]|uniref:CDP-alcohol phosphatidyltransferase family protein n=1 Tax=Halohasta salina TaxID=2961621 RepID=UPI0020A314F2|nr:CDP-alcohol phosphatidyltransferase family protein [Halohasta salina]